MFIDFFHNSFTKEDPARFVGIAKYIQDLSTVCRFDYVPYCVVVNVLL